jgi:class 3 adenylate cyclase
MSTHNEYNKTFDDNTVESENVNKNDQNGHVASTDVTTTIQLTQLGRNRPSLRKKTDFAMKSIRRGSSDWNQTLRPFVANIVFESCEQSRQYIPSNEITYNTNYQKRFRPYTCHAAVLFVDLCNYSKITSTIAHRGAHVLSSIVNEYLHRILLIVHKYGGDVIKFAGDAIIVIWYSTDEENLPMNVLLAAKCVLEMQQNAGAHPVRDTPLHFRIHCGLSCGMLESEIYTARNHMNMQRLFHSVGGNSLMELSDLVDVAKPGEVCVSNGVAVHLIQYGTFIERTDECGMTFQILSTLNYDQDVSNAMNDRIGDNMFDQQCKRIKLLEEEFIHPNVMKLLSHSGLSPTQISQMRNLCILFIAMTSSFGSTVNWLMEVQTILDKHRCPST